MSEAEHRYLTLKYFVNAVFGLGIFPFPRSRWTKACESMRAIGLLMNIHGLWQDCFSEYARRRVKAHRNVGDGGLLALGDMRDDGVAGGAADAAAGSAQESRQAMAIHLSKGLRASEDGRFGAYMILITCVAQPQQRHVHGVLADGSAETLEEYHRRGAAGCADGGGWGQAAPPRISSHLRPEREQRL
eukprot:9285998-Pyramimonas_sp.AAC.1